MLLENEMQHRPSIYTYDQHIVPAKQDIFALLYKLTQADYFHTSMIYEEPNNVWVAGDALVEVIVTTKQVILRESGQNISELVRKNVFQ